jgi:phospholipid/cholesterol/gamma-HCH transport system substrate-binding protein
MKRAIKNHAGDFVAILALLIFSVVVAGYILNHERLRFPFIQSTPFTINAEFQTAQAVTPGQGQSVRVSGVQVGDIGGVTLKNGYAIVKMDIDQKYKNLIHQDATALLRPRTGLKDMFVELNPGTHKAPIAKPGYTIPVSNTDPDINLDEVLGSLDSDSRAYLRLLVNGAGRGLAGRGNDLAQVLERFEPTHRDLARVNEAVAQRGADLRNLVHSLAKLNDALATKRAQITQLVNASAHVFRAFASEDSNIQRAVSDLPSTLQQTTQTLAKVQTFANELGPAARNLLPAAHSLPAANAALAALSKPSAPIVQSQIRPFVVAARPDVRNLRPAAIKLANATPNLRKVFVTLNHFENDLGYFPGGDQHGYLWWLSWLGHIGRTLFSTQDANGDFRPIFLQASCDTLANLVNINGAFGSIYNVVTTILTDAQLCPKQAAAVQSDFRRGELSPTPTGRAAHAATAAGSGASGVTLPTLPKLPTN